MQTCDPRWTKGTCTVDILFHVLDLMVIFINLAWVLYKRWKSSEYSMVGAEKKRFRRLPLHSTRWMVSLILLVLFILKMGLHFVVKYGVYQSITSMISLGIYLCTHQQIEKLQAYKLFTGLPVYWFLKSLQLLYVFLGNFEENRVLCFNSSLWAMTFVAVISLCSIDIISYFKLKKWIIGEEKSSLMDEELSDENTEGIFLFLFFSSFSTSIQLENNI